MYTAVDYKYNIMKKKKKYRKYAKSSFLKNTEYDII